LIFMLLVNIFKKIATIRWLPIYFSPMQYSKPLSDVNKVKDYEFANSCRGR
jgi:hypothetical protein